MVSEKSVKTVLMVGPTAAGKSSLAIQIALRSSAKRPVEIINADSVCFYREFNIGSAKPTALEMEQVPHHLINVADPHETYHAGRFYKECLQKIDEIRSRGATPLVVGGSGFYLKALRHGLWDAPPTSEEFRATLSGIPTAELFERVQKVDPAHAQKVGTQDRYRIIRALEIIEISQQLPSELQAQMPSEPDSRFTLWSIDRNPEELQLRMRERIETMIARGWIDEVISLRDRYPFAKALQAVGYQQVLDYLNGVEPEGRKVRPGIPGLIDEIHLAHRQLAKQQRTWIKNLKPDEQFILDQDQDRCFESFRSHL